MPNRQEHVAIGVGLAVVLILIIILVSDEHSVPTLAELLGIGTGTVLGALAPDILEPATTPNHRRAAHSLVALGGSAKVGLDPPDGLVEWRQALRNSAARKRYRRERLPPDHPDRLPLWLTEQGQEFGVGFTIGFPLGYTSHLVADGWNGKLPLLT